MYTLYLKYVVFMFTSLYIIIYFMHLHNNKLANEYLKSAPMPNKKIIYRINLIFLFYLSPNM